jgi:TolB-like protein
MAQGKDQEYFCDGLAEELTNALTRLRGLRVIARTSAFAFKGKAVDAREIGRQLNVSAVVEGGVQRSGDRLRVTVQLINAADGGHLWRSFTERATSLRSRMRLRRPS